MNSNNKELRLLINHNSQYKLIQMSDDSKLNDLQCVTQKMISLASTRYFVLNYYLSLAQFYQELLIKAQV